jgi:hypothetical protein
MEHLSEKECIALILDLSDEKKRDKTKDHLKICNECKRQYNSILPVVESYIKDKVFLPGKLKKRILSSAIELKNQKIKSKFGYKTQIIWKGAGFYASAAISVIILIIAVIFLFPEINPSKVNLQIAQIYGKANIDSVPAKRFDSVGSGNTISTDNNSTMILRFLPDYKIILMSKSMLTIDKAKLYKNKNLEVKYSLSKGTLLNKNNHDTSVRYIFATPHALIKSQDADLMLHASNNASNILLIKGKLVVQDKNSSNKITIESPGKYIITDSDGIKMIRAVDPTTQELQKIQEALDSTNFDETLAPRYSFQNADDKQKADEEANDLYEQVSRHIDSDLD